MITLKAAARDWIKTFDGLKYFKSNISIGSPYFCLPVIELVKLPHGINEYRGYYQLYSMFREDAFSFKNEYLINYGLNKADGLQFCIDLKVTREMHFELIQKNASIIERQFIVPFNDVINDADYLLEALDQFLETEKFSENRIPVFVFMLQLSKFSSHRQSFFFDKYFDKIVNYRVLPIYFELTFRIKREQFIDNLSAYIADKKSLESILNQNLIDFKGKI